ncbi:MAG: non-canonical purine NTP pyrophosphatase [Patescibacteria group bacterium]
MKVYFVTSNVSKYEEISKTLQNYNISILRKDIDISEIKSMDIREVVIDKAKKAFSIIKKPVFVDDTGIFFKGYNNFPGTHSRFIFKTLGFKGIFKLINNQQSACFKSYIAYLDDTMKEPIIFIGICKGYLINKILGPKRKKMPYDNIFIPQREAKTFAELGITGKQKYDHRSKATKKLAQYLNNHINLLK